MTHTIPLVWLFLRWQIALPASILIIISRIVDSKFPVNSNSSSNTELKPKSLSSIIAFFLFLSPTIVTNIPALESVMPENAWQKLVRIAEAISDISLVSELIGEIIQLLFSP